MPTRLPALMTGVAPVATASFLAPIWFLGHLPNKKWSPALAPNQSTEGEQMRLLKLLGLNLFFMNFPLLPLDFLSFSVTISMPHTKLPILFCMPAPNMWK